MVMVLFATGFYLIYRHDRNSPPAFWYMLAYTSGAIGFTLDFGVRDAAGPLLGPYVSNVWLLAIPALLTFGIARQCKRSLPVRSVLFCYVGAFVAATVFLFAWPNPSARVMSMNGGTGLLLALSLPYLWSARHRPLAKLLFVLCSLTAIQMFVRPALVIYYAGLDETHGSYSNSVYALTLHFSSAICAISVAATLMFSLAMDMMRRLHKRSDTDSLTNLLNRRGFENSANEMLAKAERSEVPISMIVCDIDHFKQVNDNYGHIAGDSVIASFGSLVATSVRETDSAGRIGGEEFCILLWNCDSISAQKIAEKLRKKFRSTVFENLGNKTLLSASFGVSQWKHGMGYRETFAKADAALYRAKRAGRDRVICDLPVFLLKDAA